MKPNEVVSFEGKAFLGTMLGGTLFGAILGMVYGAAIWYSPWLPLCVLFTMALAWSLGQVMAKLAIRSVMPHRGVLLGLVAWTGIVALYMAWATEVAIRVPGVGVYSYDPRLVAAYLQGAGLAAIWVAELLIVVGGARGVEERAPCRW